MLGRRLEWSEGAVVTGTGEALGAQRTLARLALVLPDAAALRAVGRHPMALVGVSEARIEVARWRAPLRGWTGRLGPIRELLRSEVRVSTAGGGRVRITIALASARPLREVIAAVEGVLMPGSTLPVTHASSVGTRGRLPQWLPLAADVATRFVMPPGTPSVPGIDPVTGAQRTPEDPPPNRPAVDAELVMDGTPSAGLGLIAAPVVRVTREGIDVTDARPAITAGVRRQPVLVDVRGERHPWVSPGLSGRHVVVEVRSTDAGTRWRPRVRADDGPGAHRGGAPVGPWLGLDVPLTAIDAVERATWWSVDWDIDDRVEPAGVALAVVRAALRAPVVAGGRLPAPVRGHLDPGLAAVLERPLPSIDEPLAWERRSVSQRRAAVRGHATSLLMEPSIRPGGTAPVSPPTVSALLVTRRPRFAASALRALERQTYPRLEVVLVLHGVPPDAALGRAVADARLPLELLTVPPTATLGEALGMATARARGSLLTKVDDDDIYGPEHIWDLVVGRAVSGATVVGKPGQFVLLDRLGITVRRDRPSSDTYGRVVAGGTMLIARGELEAMGGWRPVRTGVDRALLDRVLHAGGTIYQTSPFGFIYRRHGQGHTWDVEDEYFLRGAIGRWQGIPDLPEFGEPEPLDTRTDR